MLLYLSQATAHSNCYEIVRFYALRHLIGRGKILRLQRPMSAVWVEYQNYLELERQGSRSKYVMQKLLVLRSHFVQPEMLEQQLLDYLKLVTKAVECSHFQSLRLQNGVSPPAKRYLHDCRRRLAPPAAQLQRKNWQMVPQ